NIRGSRTGCLHGYAMSRLAASLLSLSITLALSPALAAPPADAPTFDPQRLSEMVETLSADDFEGRGPATAGEQQTIDYGAAALRAAGVQPGGDLQAGGTRGWTQAVQLLRSNIAGTPALSVSVDGKPRALTQGEEIAVRAAMDGSKSVEITDAPIVFVGYGVTAPERDWDDFKGVDLEGKIALVLVNDPDYETGEGDFGGK